MLRSAEATYDSRKPTGYVEALRLSAAQPSTVMEVWQLEYGV